MIAAIEWIPAGRANPTPTKYEYSRAERDFLARVTAAQSGEGGGGDLAAPGGGGDAANNGPDAAGSDEEWEVMEQEGGGEGKTKLPKVDLASLPADLRMDEYSDDDDDEDKEKDVGGLLVGKDAEMMGDFQPNNAVEPNNGEGDHDDHDDDSDSEDEDDLADIPDTREYMPLDLKGLQSLGIGGQNYSVEDLQNMTLNNQHDLDNDLDDDEEEEEDEEDANDIKLHDGDALVVVAKTEEDFASLEVNVFDTEGSNLYVHHDIPLPGFPLCLALGSVAPSYQSSFEDSNGGDDEGSSNNAKVGNYVAVGSFEPGIEIWNLDVMNALEPTLVLGGMDTSGAEEDWMRMQNMPTSTNLNSNSNGGGGGKKKKKKKKAASRGKPGLREGSHTDAVMGLSWNTVHPQVLASGSADGTVKLWDVTSNASDYVRPSSTLTHHTDKVQSLAWHPTEGTLLATGGYDRKVCLVDARSPSNVKKAKLLADCEAIVWDPHNPQYLTAASEDGVVQCWDVRNFGGDPVWSMVAHEYGGVSDICYNSKVPGMLISCSIDKTVALWDTSAQNQPQPCGSKDMNVGKLYSVSIYPSSPWLLSCGGSGNELAIWDMEHEDAIRNRFAGRIGESIVAPEGEEPDFEAAMATGDDVATALESMNKSKKKKGKKKNKAHKRK